MKVHFIETGFLKLDGGAMFGIVPKRMWAKLNPPDENNLCTWAMRCLLIETDDQRRILVDTGLGDKQDAKFRSHFEPHGEDTLLKSLAAKGFSPEDITDVFLTHLHFDHVGGAVVRSPEGGLMPTFPNAVYWSNEVHWHWAMNPNEREAASFLKENFVPLQDAGVLKFIHAPILPETDVEWLPGIRLRFLYGHTEAMMMLFIDAGPEKYAYCADLLPSVHHIGMPYVMAYDLRPLQVLAEKKRLLQEALEGDYSLIFEHDPKVQCSKVIQTESGRIVAAS